MFESGYVRERRKERKEEEEGTYRIAGSLIL